MRCRTQGLGELSFAQGIILKFSGNGNPGFEFRAGLTVWCYPCGFCLIWFLALFDFIALHRLSCCRQGLEC